MGLHPDLEQRHSSTEIPDLDPLRRTLDANQDWYQDIVEHSQDLLCIHNLEGRLLSVNPAPARALGYSVDELLRTSMRELVVPEFRLQFDAYLAEVGRTGQSHGLINLITRAGERRVWRYYSTLRTEGVAHPIVRGIAHDITEQFRAEKSMREISEKLLSEVRKSEVTIRELQLFRTLLDNSNDAIEVLDPKTCRFLDVNAKACEDLGYSREELLSMKASDINTQMTEAAIETQREKLETNGSLVWESIHRRKDGITFPVEVSMKLVRLDRDYAIAVCRDLTERRMAESRLKATEERNQLVHERAPVGICWVESKTGRLLRVNPKYCEIVGRTEKDLLNRDFQSLTHPDDLPRNLEKLRQLRDGEIRSYEIEKKYFRPDGSVRWVHVEAAATCPEGQLPVWHMAIVQDVTERKRAKERLREFERVVENLEEYGGGGRPELSIHPRQQGIPAVLELG
jgi:PAS domain S-box-containing protein